LPRAYLGNALAAAAAADVLGARPFEIAGALRRFRGLAHRCQLVAEFDGVRVIDDGIALTPRKALAALAGMRPNSVHLICGGDDVVVGWSVAPLHGSGEETALFDAFCGAAIEKAKRLFLVGSAADRLREALARCGVDERIVKGCRSLEAATDGAIRAAAGGDTVLLAPIFDLGEAELNAFPEYVSAAVGRRAGSGTYAATLPHRRQGRSGGS
jgi:UDP-N-acetylmuramoylalanine--D-glutamate ligase